jgi:hypothetical protein
MNVYTFSTTAMHEDFEMEKGPVNIVVPAEDYAAAEAEALTLAQDMWLPDAEVRLLPQRIEKRDEVTA